MTELEKAEDLHSFLQEGYQRLLLLKFFTVWCGPCRKLNESIKNLLKEKKGILVLEINAEKFPNLAQEYGVSSVPSLFLFYRGEIVKKAQGYMDLDQLKEFIRI